MRLARVAVLVCTLAWSAPPSNVTAAASTCHATIRVALALPGRVDSLQAAGTTGSVLALVGHPGSRVRFLPRDNLEVLYAGHSAAPSRVVTIPQYLMAPGLATRPDGARLYLLEDNRLLTLDGASGTILARQQLPLQAIGWPAAITADNTAVYLIGQPGNAWAAQAYALVADGNGAMRARWRVSLGLTHAGSWIGLAGGDQLAVYLPDAYDAHGTIELVDRTSGAQHQSYDLTAPPIAADAMADRLYLAEGGMIRALALRSGTAIAAAPGSSPLAVDPVVGLVAYARDDRLMVAGAAGLRPLLELPMPGGVPPTALAWQGSRLIVGNARGVVSLQRHGCSARPG